ncbi:MAG: hypothetical protein VB934_17140 [Polyangiaceae bacterium]
MTKHHLTALALLTATMLAATAHADVVVLTDGGVFNGEVVENRPLTLA